MEPSARIPRQEGGGQPPPEPLMAEFAKQMIDPPGGDPRISLFYQGMLEVMHGRGVDAADQEAVQRSADILRKGANLAEPEPIYAANKILRCFQKQFMYRGVGSQYPFSAQSVEPWRDAIIGVLKTGHFSEVMIDLYTRETQSNVVQRYNALKFILNAGLTFSHEMPQVIDVGCSQNMGLKKIALGGAFEPVRVMKAGPGYNHPEDRTASRRYNKVVAAGLKLGRSVGVDLFDLRDTDNIEWVYACSSYPSELLNEARRHETQELQRAQVPTVDFAHADITRDPLVTIPDQPPIVDRRLYDVAYAATSMYQMTEREREATYQTVYERLTPDGIMVIQDFVRASGSKLEFSGPGSDRFTYRTYVKSKAGDFETAEEIFIWETARCTKLQLGLGKLIVQHSSLSVRELLAQGGSVVPALFRQ